MKLIQGNNLYIFIVPESKEEADQIFAALSAGGKIEITMDDQPWEDYYGSFRDKFGVMSIVDIEIPNL